MPAIIRFLGYNPLPEATVWADRLVQGRKALGLSQKEAASRIGVDPARWRDGSGGSGSQPAGSRFVLSGC